MSIFNVLFKHTKKVERIGDANMGAQTRAANTWSRARIGLCERQDPKRKQFILSVFGYVVGKVIRGLIALLVVMLGFFSLFSLGVATGKLPDFKLFVVESGSMEPQLPFLSMILVRKSDTLSVGDVITVKDSASSLKTYTHRIVKIEENNGQKSYITKGDANDSFDTLLALEKDIVGKLVFVVPYIGFINIWARSPAGFFFIVVVPFVFVILGELGLIAGEIGKAVENVNYRRFCSRWHKI
jgi:signal peptidase